MTNMPPTLEMFVLRTVEYPGRSIVCATAIDVTDGLAEPPDQVVAALEARTIGSCALMTR